MTVDRGLWPWLLQRITGLLLAAGLIVHFFVLHFTLERPVTLEKVALRLGHPAWVAFDCLLLLACVFHALNGLHSILLDFSPSPALRRAATVACWIAGGIMTAVGMANLIPLRY